MFIIGSVLFFKTATVTAGTWLFLIGSVFFAVRPVVHVVRDMHMKRKRPAWAPLTGSVFEVPGCQVCDAIDRIIGDP